MNREVEKMNNQRVRVSILTTLLMAGLAINMVPMCYATEPEPSYNETAVEERLDNIEKLIAEMTDMVDNIDEIDSRIEYLETKLLYEITRLTNIMYVCITIVVIAILGTFVTVKRMGDVR